MTEAEGRELAKAFGESKERNTEVMTPEEIMDKMHLDLAYWQRQLRLDSVDIELQWITKDRQEDEETMALVDSEPTCHRFVIFLRHPDDLTLNQKNKVFNSDYEVCLVHELLHVRDDAWNSKKFQKLMEEEVFMQAHETSVDAVAEALVRARRGIQR